MHARGGARQRYAPVQTAAGFPIEPGNARMLAEVYTDLLGVAGLYAADLDAILDRTLQDDLTRSLTTLRPPLWLDAGVQSVDEARHVLDLGAARVVVGLETLPSFDALTSICAAVGGDRVAFSLDLRDGRPVIRSGAQLAADASPESLAELAVIAGVGAVIVIDLARVGRNAGVDAGLLGRLRAAASGVTLVAGGGVRGWDDLVQLGQAGCDAALVATALHTGRIGTAEIAAAQQL